VEHKCKGRNLMRHRFHPLFHKDPHFLYLQKYRPIRFVHSFIYPQRNLLHKWLFCQIRISCLIQLRFSTFCNERTFRTFQKSKFDRLLREILFDVVIFVQEILFSFFLFQKDLLQIWIICRRFWVFILLFHWIIGMEWVSFFIFSMILDRGHRDHGHGFLPLHWRQQWKDWLSLN